MKIRVLSSICILLSSVSLVHAGTTPPEDSLEGGPAVPAVQLELDTEPANGATFADGPHVRRPVDEAPLVIEPYQGIHPAVTAIPGFSITYLDLANMGIISADNPRVAGTVIDESDKDFLRSIRLDSEDADALTSISYIPSEMRSAVYALAGRLIDANTTDYQKMGWLRVLPNLLPLDEAKIHSLRLDPDIFIKARNFQALCKRNLEAPLSMNALQFSAFLKKYGELARQNRYEVGHFIQCLAYAGYHGSFKISRNGLKDPTLEDKIKGTCQLLNMFCGFDLPFFHSPMRVKGGEIKRIDTRPTLRHEMTTIANGMDIPRVE